MIAAEDCGDHDLHEQVEEIHQRDERNHAERGECHRQRSVQQR
jgi:hypothetical protein